MSRAIHANVFGTQVTLHTEVPGKLHFKFIGKPVPLPQDHQNAQDPSTSSHKPSALFQSATIIVDSVKSSVNWTRAKWAPSQVLQRNAKSYIKFDDFGRTFYSPRLYPEDETEDDRRRQRSQAGIRMRDFALHPAPSPSLATESSSSDSTAPHPKVLSPSFVNLEEQIANYIYVLLMASKDRGVLRDRQPVYGDTLYRLLHTGIISREEASRMWMDQDWEAYKSYKQAAQRFASLHPNPGVSVVAPEGINAVWDHGYPWVPTSWEPDHPYSIEGEIQPCFWLGNDGQWKFKRLDMQNRDRIYKKWYNRTVARQNALHGNMDTRKVISFACVLYNPKVPLGKRKISDGEATTTDASDGNKRRRSDQTPARPRTLSRLRDENLPADKDASEKEPSKNACTQPPSSGSLDDSSGAETLSPSQFFGAGKKSTVSSPVSSPCPPSPSIQPSTGKVVSPTQCGKEIRVQGRSRSPITTSGRKSPSPSADPPLPGPSKAVRYRKLSAPVQSCR